MKNLMVSLEVVAAPVHPVHKNAEIGSTGRKGRKAKNALYSCVFGLMLLEINNLRNLG
jgi:hypothetical protein